MESFEKIMVRTGIKWIHKVALSVPTENHLRKEFALASKEMGSCLFAVLNFLLPIDFLLTGLLST